MQRMASVVTLMLCLTAILPFIWHVKMSQEEDDDEKVNAELGRVLHRLEAIQRENEKWETRKQFGINSTIHETYPWAEQNNTLPNYFLHSNRLDNVEGYRSGAVVFMHHHRSAGTAIRQCMDSIAEKNALASSPVMGSNDRLDWDNKEGLNSDFRDRLKFHRGQYTFGMCDGIRRDCSYFTILRDPMERAVSSHEYCKEAYGDEMCKVTNANELSLREWILHHGSLMFHQLLFQTQWCHLVNVSGTTQEKNSLTDKPCWYKHKSRLDQINSKDYQHLVNYVVDNLENWFAVIGIYEDLDTSLRMLEHAYKLPFTKCDNLRKVEVEANVNDNRSNRKKRRLGYYDDNDPEYLKYDYEIQQVLDADIKIYKKARKIFQIQRQMLSNKLTR